MCSLGLAICIYSRYDIKLRWNISKGLLTKNDNLMTSGEYKYLIVEILINIIAPYPFFNSVKYKERFEEYHITIEYGVNDLLLFYSFIRIYLIIRMVLYLTQFMSPRS